MRTEQELREHLKFVEEHDELSNDFEAGYHSALVWMLDED